VPVPVPAPNAGDLHESRSRSPVSGLPQTPNAARVHGPQSSQTAQGLRGNAHVPGIAEAIGALQSSSSQGKTHAQFVQELDAVASAFEQAESGSQEDTHALELLRDIFLKEWRSREGKLSPSEFDRVEAALTRLNLGVLADTLRRAASPADDELQKLPPALFNSSVIPFLGPRELQALPAVSKRLRHAAGRSAVFATQWAALKKALVDRDAAQRAFEVERDTRFQFKLKRRREEYAARDTEWDEMAQARAVEWITEIASGNEGELPQVCRLFARLAQIQTRFKGAGPQAGSLLQAWRDFIEIAAQISPDPDCIRNLGAPSGPPFAAIMRALMLEPAPAQQNATVAGYPRFGRPEPGQALTFSLQHADRVTGELVTKTYEYPVRDDIAIAFVKFLQSDGHTAVYIVELNPGPLPDVEAVD